MSQDPNDVPSVNGEDDATEESEMGVEVEVVKMDLDKAVAITTALGFVDRCQIFSTDAEARLFITSHLFLQRRGKHPLSLFVRFTCADPRCAFTARFFRNEETSEAMVRLSDDRPWHDEGCSRVKKGAHGLSALIRANSEKLTAEKVPLRSVVANQLRLQGTAPSTKQLANARYYKNVCLNKEFDRDPLKFLEDKYPGSRVFRKVFVDAEGLPVDVVHLCRDLLLRELATEGHILLDATYATAPTGGFTITLGFSRYNSFVPVYCAVFARQGTRAKVRAVGQSAVPCVRCRACGAVRAVTCVRCRACGAVRAVPCVRCRACGVVRSVRVGCHACGAILAVHGTARMAPQAVRCRAFGAALARAVDFLG